MNVGGEVGHALAVCVAAIFTQNILLAYFLGLCPFIGVSREVKTAFVDGFFNALGYTFILLIVATFREILGMGTFMKISGAPGGIKKSLKEAVEGK